MTQLKSLWGEIPLPEKLPNLPKKILKEQGSVLTDSTSGMLIGEVIQGSQDKRTFSASLRITVPSLNNYVFSILSVQYPIELYPLTLTDHTNENKKISCKNVDEYEKHLGGILSSNKVKETISALLAHVSSDEIAE